MASSVITAATPANRPVDDMNAYPEGGPTPAAAAAAAMLGRPLAPMMSKTMYGAGFPAWRMATYGRTAIFAGVEHDDLTVPPGFGVFSIAYQSVTGAYVITVDSSAYQRFVALSPGEVEIDEGSPLPFEEPFWSGAHDQFPGETPAFDVDDWADAGALWMFGRSLAGGIDTPHGVADT